MKKNLTHTEVVFDKTNYPDLFCKEKNCPFGLNSDCKHFIFSPYHKKKKSRKIKVVYLIWEKWIIVVYRKN